MNLIQIKIFIVFFILISLSTMSIANTCKQADQQEESRIRSILPTFESIVSEAMELSHVPGLSLAIVYRDHVILVKGFGKKNIDATENNDVDENTIFQIASLSKPFTSTIIAKLITDNPTTLDWDTKVISLDKDFALSDPVRTEQLTIGDLLAHHSGLPDHAGDLLEDLGYSQQQIIHQLRFITQLGIFREQYNYTNFGFSEAAFAIAEHQNTEWGKLANRFIDDDLNMYDTSYYYDDYINSKNRADIHVIKNNSVTPNQNTRNPDAQAPAGGLSTNAVDASKWLLLLTNNGCYLNNQLIDPKVLNEAQTRHQFSPKSPSYGYGWNVHTNDNDEVENVNHSGAFAMGIRSFVMIDKKQDVGIAIFSNAAMSGLPELLGKVFFQLLNKEDTTHWRNELKVFNDKMLSEEEDNELPSGGEKQPADLRKYVGVYDNDYFGPLTISESNQCKRENTCLKATISSGTVTNDFELIYHSPDVFYMKTIGEMATGYTKVQFNTNEHEIVIDAFNKFGKGSFRAE